jgi:uncharacterized protein YjbK
VQEMEYKRMLTRDTYRHIAEWMDNAYAPPEFVQINYYYDTAGYALHGQDVTLRVRQVDGRLLCQCKFESEQDARDTARTELTREIHALPLAIVPGKLFDHPKAGAMPEVRLLGALVTERRVHVVEPGVSVMLDRSHYLGHTDWELEIEYDGDKEARARHWCGRLCPESGLVIGKRARFVEVYRRLYA